MRKERVLLPEDIIFPLKKISKTCNRGFNLASKTGIVWICIILWNSWPVVHYTVRITYWHNVTSLLDVDVSNMETTHKVHWSINPLSRTPPPLFLQAPLKSANYLSLPFLGNPPTSSFFLQLTLKIEFFSEPK